MHKRPIKYIIAEGWDVGFYATKEYAENYYEAIDVEQGIYRGYDSEGRLLRLCPKGAGCEITLAENEPTHSEELQNLLVGLLALRGRTPERVDLEFLLKQFEMEVR